MIRPMTRLRLPLTPNSQQGPAPPSHLRFVRTLLTMAGNKKTTDKAAKGGDKASKAGDKAARSKASSSKDDKSGDASGSKLKPATSINVRHILVSQHSLPHCHSHMLRTLIQCEKHSKKEEALTKLRDGAKFDDVAREFSEDKARQGAPVLYLPLSILFHNAYHHGI